MKNGGSRSWRDVLDRVLAMNRFRKLKEKHTSLLFAKKYLSGDLKKADRIAYTPAQEASMYLQGKRYSMAEWNRNYLERLEAQEIIKAEIEAANRREEEYKANLKELEAELRPICNSYSRKQARIFRKQKARVNKWQKRLDNFINHVVPRVKSKLRDNEWRWLVDMQTPLLETVWAFNPPVVKKISFTQPVKDLYYDLDYTQTMGATVAYENDYVGQKQTT